MPSQKARSPFDRLRQQLDGSARRCRACGYVDTEGGWRVTAASGRVRYQRVCPSCGAVETRDVHLE